jgi:hypothetical protein
MGWGRRKREVKVGEKKKVTKSETTEDEDSIHQGIGGGQKEKKWLLIYDQRKINQDDRKWS